MDTVIAAREALIAAAEHDPLDEAMSDLRVASTRHLGVTCLAFTGRGARRAVNLAARQPPPAFWSPARV
jgi:hypothetical protein